MTPFKIEAAGRKHAVEWATLRAQLWPDSSVAEHAVEVEAALADGSGRTTTFVAVDLERVLGVVEASLRTDYVNGCDTSPVAFIEGLYVRPDSRDQGVAGRLCEAVAAWGRELGCRELGSDADLDNSESQAFHLAIGFEETERVVFFRKRL